MGDYAGQTCPGSSRPRGAGEGGDRRAVLVTGGAGFIGSNFVRGLIEAGGFEVVNLDALTYAGNLDNLSSIVGHPNHAFVEGDIGDGELVGRLLAEHSPGAIVNFAAETHVDRSVDDPGSFVRTNVVGTFELLEGALAYWSRSDGAERQGFRFLHVSTDEVYGSLGDSGLFTEESPYAPNSPYAASKAAADHLVRAYHHTYGLPTVTTRCSNNHGPFQHPEKLIPLTIRNALAGEPIPVYGDGGNVRDWLYVEDHCRAVLGVLDRGRPGEAYNVGASAERTNLEVVHAVCGLLDELVPGSPFVPHASLVTLVEDRPGHDRRYAIDAARIRSELGWSPRESFESGLEKTVRWYLDNRERRALPDPYRRVRSGGEA